MGKTRLAIAAAEQQLLSLTTSNGKDEYQFPDGVFFVPLAPLDRTEAVIPAIGKALGFQFLEGVDPKKQILNYFRRKRMLLLLDNFEHLMDGAPLLTEIVQAARDVKFLVTSRVKLNLQSEVPYILRGMRFPEEQDQIVEEPFSAVELFLKRTSRIQHDFFPGDEEMMSIGRICRLVEGMPLGVELAASWMEVLSPGEIASEIQRSLDFLQVEVGDVPDRHQSIRAVFDYTWHMLSEEERDVLKKISVFRGGFTTDAAREVAGASNQQLLALVNKSLLQRGSKQRFEIHSLLRKYVEEILNQNQVEKERVSDLHCEYFAQFLSEREDAIEGGDNRESVAEMDNTRIGWKWAVRHKKIPELRKQMQSFSSLYEIQGWYTEGEEVFTWAMDMLSKDGLEGERGIVFGQILGYLGSFRCRMGKYDNGMNLFRQSRDILRRLEAKSELAVCDVAFQFADNVSRQYTEEVRKNLLESLEYYEDMDISWQKAHVLLSLGNIGGDNKGNDGEYYYRRGLQIGEEINSHRIIGWAFSGLGFIAKIQGDLETTRVHWEKSLAHARAMKYKPLIGWQLNALGDVLIHLSKYEEARKHFLEAKLIYENMAVDILLGWSLNGLGNVALEVGELRKWTRRGAGFIGHWISGSGTVMK
jgi:tetratricopeptide (TPR) repeat protein